MSWSSHKKTNRTSFLKFILPCGNFRGVCILSPCIEYWINFQNIYIYAFTYQKALLYTPFCLFLKSSKVINVSLTTTLGIQTSPAILNSEGTGQKVRDSAVFEIARIRQENIRDSKKTNFTCDRFSMIGWAGQLSMINATFLPSVWNFFFTSLTQIKHYPSSSFFVIDIYREVS